MKTSLLSLVLLTTGCTGITPAEPGPAPVEGARLGACHLHSPRNIAMWINAMPGPDAHPALISTFKAIAPTPGYKFSLKVLEVKESYPPQYVFGLAAAPPTGIVPQVETELDIRVEIPSFDYREIASATVMCGGKPLFVLDSVETAH